MGDQQEFYEPTGGETIQLDEDGFPYILAPDGEAYYYADPDEAEAAEAEFFPDLQTPEAVEDVLAGLPPEGRLEWLQKNAPDDRATRFGKAGQLRRQWQSALLEACDSDRPAASEEFETYLQLSRGDA